MAKIKADTNSIENYFNKNIKKIGSIKFEYAEKGGQSVDLSFKGKLNTTQQNTVKTEVLNILNENFYGAYEIGKIKFDDDFGYVESLLTIKVVQSGSASSVPTKIQEAGSAFILTQVLKKNKKFDSAADILNDNDTNTKLKKIFKGYESGINDWVHSYYEHQKAFFKKFQPSQWTIFEHGGQDFMEFIKKQAQIVKEVTPSGKLKEVGRYETWNPSDIWAVNNKDMVKKKIDDAIQKDGKQTLTELNAVLLNLMKDDKLIGLSLKKIEKEEQAKFVYVNKDPRDVEFAEIEKVKLSDIKIEIKTGEQDNGKSMNQGGYALFGKYTIYIIKTPAGGKFANLKFESVIKGSGGRGGAAPVELVQSLMKSKIPGHTFVNRHQDYPETAEQFKNDKRNYEAMYNILRSNIDGTSNYAEFAYRIVSMYRSNDQKIMSVAQSKLMQLHFFSDVLSKTKDKQEEFWTDLLYLSLKVGKRFAPHGKLA